MQELKIPLKTKSRVCFLAGRCAELTATSRMVSILIYVKAAAIHKVLRKTMVDLDNSKGRRDYGDDGGCDTIE